MKIILVDDHSIIRDGLRSLLEKQPNMEIIAESDNVLTQYALQKRYYQT